MPLDHPPTLSAAPATADDFVAWALQQEGNYEFVNGEILAMPGDSGGHNRCKGRIFRMLEDAISASRLTATAYTDGMTVRIPGGNVRGADATVVLAPFDPAVTIIDDPVVLFEVISASSVQRDIEVKLIDYFAIPSLVHYVIVHLDAGAVLHHRRGSDGVITTLIRRDGELDLAPPGITIPVRPLLELG
jgi:Uma2 family endonuclease